MDKVMFYMAYASLVTIFLLLGFVIIFRAKTKLSKYFIAYLVELLIWTFSVIAEDFCARSGHDNLVIFFENLTYIGISFIAVTILMIGLSFNVSAKKKQLLRAFIVLCIVPAITQIIIWTNEFHHFFYISYDLHNKSGIQLGWYFFVHTVYSYVCLLVGMGLIIRFAFNSRGNSRWQAIVVCAGSAIPLVVNICYTFDIGNFSIFSTPVAFMITMITYLVGIFRFNLLRVTPIALRTVMDKTSDLYIVIDQNMRILDYNEPFFKVFGQHIDIKKNMDLHKVIDAHKIGITPENFFGIINDCREMGRSVTKDFELLSSGKMNYYSAEFAPLVIGDSYCGCIVLLRDITRAKNDMEEIKRNQTMLIERERLASLGQLMGGIAHNLKTPIMAVSGRIENLRELIGEYETSMSDDNVTKEDHAEIAKEMHREVGKIKKHMSYISDIISAVKNQTVQFNTMMKISFSVKELIERVQILLQHELMSKNCELVVEFLLPEDLTLKGDINSLVQIIDNIIINAIQAYNSLKSTTGEPGIIKLKTWRANNELSISISDNAGGIKKEVQEKLFRQMITTKGTEGTGLGLYISFSTVVGMFAGKMSFTSTEGQGTEFLVTLPLEPENVKADTDE